MNEQHVAFHDIVTLIGWTDSSAQGAKVKFALADRGALAHFDTATRRRGKRAGQRYAAAISTLDGEPLMGLELWFAGANWAHQDGARAAFTVEDLDFFRGLSCRDQKPDEAFSCWLTLVEVGDDETPVDQAKAELVEEPEAPPRKGGPRSKNAARLCHDDEFQWYVSEQDGLDDKASVTEADAYLKRIVGIGSKIDLDYDDEAWARLETKVKSPFLLWAGG